jgi:hypothetical protein
VDYSLPWREGDRQDGSRKSGFDGRAGRIVAILEGRDRRAIHEGMVALVAVLAAGLLVLAALVGTRPTGKQMVDVLPVVGGPIEETLHRPVVAAFLAATLLVLLIGAIRGAAALACVHAGSHRRGGQAVTLPIAS